MTRWTEHSDLDDDCPTIAAWEAFWADPPTDLAEPRMAEYRAWLAEVLADRDFGEEVCHHCMEQVRRAMALVQALEDAAGPPRDFGVAQV
jgi:hypothetical protein